MPYRILWTDRAFSRLEEQADYIAADDSVAARRMLERTFERVESLAEMPESGRVFPGANDRSLRELIVGQYRVIYRVVATEKAIHVITVRHGRQQPLSADELDI